MSKGQKKKQKQKRAVTFIQLSENTKTRHNVELPVPAKVPPLQAELQRLFKDI